MGSSELTQFVEFTCWTLGRASDSATVGDGSPVVDYLLENSWKEQPDALGAAAVLHLAAWR